MSKYNITYGERAEDVVTLEIANITDASEIFNAAYAKLHDRQLAYAVLAAVDAGKFKKNRITDLCRNLSKENQ